MEKAGIRKNLVINKLASNVSEQEIEARRKLLAALKVHPREQEENRYLLERGERLYEQFLGDQRVQVGQLMAQFLAVLEKQDPHAISRAREAFNRALGSIERGEVW